MLSIIIPVYNSEKTIIKLLDSICNIDTGDYEVICVNDGSTDNSELLIKKYIAKHKNVKLISQENSGPSKARNRGILAAKGEYITFADSDDVYITANLKKVFKILEANKDISLFVFSYVETSNENMKYVGVQKENIIEITKYLKLAYTSMGDLYVHALWNKVYKKDLLKDVGGLNNNIRLGEDAICNLKCLQKIEKVYVSEIEIYKYRLFDVSLSHGTKSFSILYDCYRNIISGIKELSEKRKFNFGIEQVIQKYYLGIINAYIVSEYVEFEDKIKLRECLKLFRKERCFKKKGSFFGFNKVLYVLVTCRFYNIGVALCDIQRNRKRNI